MGLNYIAGDVTDPPKVDGIRSIIIHGSNCYNGFGNGVAGAISRKFPEVKAAYHKWHDDGERGGVPFKQGRVLIVPTKDKSILVANVISQSYFGFDLFGLPPVRYQALEEGLIRLREKTKDHSVSYHMPRICCGLAGGKWEIVEDIITRVFKDTNVPITIYDLPTVG